ncbi:pyridoxamine 5'-phosphate oxidase family protein [Alphaproteobacteria bacterium]|nr:pyridoxamine 5'-phosphate oxidase family protein [Alphaproteobacteria bacterium]
MLDQNVKDYNERSVLCWLATVDGDQPSVSPKEIFTNYGDDTIMIANIASPQSIKNISKTNRVCVSFIDIFSQKGSQLYGVANRPKLLSASDKDKLAILQNLAGSAFPVKSFIDIKITKVKSIIAPSYRFNKNITEEEMIRGALKTYGVTSGS